MKLVDRIETNANNLALTLLNNQISIMDKITATKIAQQMGILWEERLNARKPATKPRFLHKLFAEFVVAVFINKSTVWKIIDYQSNNLSFPLLQPR